MQTDITITHSKSSEIKDDTSITLISYEETLAGMFILTFIEQHNIGRNSHHSQSKR